MIVRQFLLLCTLFFPSFAHDLYLRPSTFQAAPGQLIRVEYHNGDSFPQSEVPASIDRLRDMQLKSSSGVHPFTNLRIEGKATVADVPAPNERGSFVLISRTIPNFIELDSAKFEKYLTEEGLEQVVGWRREHGEAQKPGREIYSKYVKALGFVGASQGGFDRPIGLALEFVPLADPYQLKTGETLPVRVLLHGQPKSGLMIEAAQFSEGKVTEQHVGRTDAHGEIRLPMTGTGLWKLHTIHMARCTNTKEADWESLWASLTFELMGGAR